MISSLPGKALRMLVDIARLAEGFKVRKTARIRNRLEGNKITINITNKSQEVSLFPSGDHKAAMNRRESDTDDPQKKYRFGTVSKMFY